MRVCFDTNCFIRLFSRAPAYDVIRRALTRGRLTMLVSTEILLEYREVVEQRARFVTWTKFESVLEMLKRFEAVVEVTPHFRFSAVTGDPDDNKFADCAIAGDAKFIVTYDADFRSVPELGYRPQPITPEQLAARLSGPEQR